MPFSKLVGSIASASLSRPCAGSIPKTRTQHLHTRHGREYHAEHPQLGSARQHKASQAQLTTPPARHRTLTSMSSTSSAAAAPIVFRRTLMACSRKKFISDLNELFSGNKEYVANMSEQNPGLLSSLAMEGQKPPFMLVDCSDSRVSEQDIFSAQPGTIFTAGNIANRFDEDDLNSNAVLSFAVEALKVKHVVVMGHYGCGGVAESMMPPKPKPKTALARTADVAVQGWIQPIRELYLTSTRPEIVAHREACKLQPMNQVPHLHDPAFRALVEENVKTNVRKIAKSAVIRDHYLNVTETNGDGPTASAQNGDLPPVTEVFIHGFVYDVETGKVSDLGVSVGPPGRVLPASPFPLVGAALAAAGKGLGGSCRS